MSNVVRKVLAKRAAAEHSPLQRSIFGRSVHGTGRKNLGTAARVSLRERVLVDATGDDDTAGMITLQGRLFELGTGGSPPVVGILEWGVAGGLNRVEFDWGRGFTVSVVASAARLLARAQRDTGELESFPEVQAHAGWFPSASLQPVTLSELSQTLPANPGALTFDVPNFAKAVTAVTFSAAIPGPTIALRQNDSSGDPQGGASGTGEVRMKLHNATRQVVVANQEASALELTVIWELDL